MNLFFETPKNAATRVQKQKELGKSKSHSPKFISGDLEDLMEDLPSWPDKINWSEMARKFHIRKEGSEVQSQNAGQILKDNLVSQNVDISRCNKVPKKGKDLSS